MNLDELLGIDTDDPEQMLAERLVQADDQYLDALIARRRSRGLTVAQVAERIGVNASTIARLENGDRDPRLSLLRLYALAVSADVRHVVTPYRHNEVTKAQVNEALVERGGWGERGSWTAVEALAGVAAPRTWGVDVIRAALSHVARGETHVMPGDRHVP